MAKTEQVVDAFYPLTRNTLVPKWWDHTSQATTHVMHRNNFAGDWHERGDPTLDFIENTWHSSMIHHQHYILQLDWEWPGSLVASCKGQPHIPAWLTRALFNSSRSAIEMKHNPSLQWVGIWLKTPWLGQYYTQSCIPWTQMSSSWRFWLSR